MGRLANRFDDLLDQAEEGELIDAVNYEEIDLDDVVEIALETLEGKSHHLDLIDKEIECIDQEGEAVSVESFSEEFITFLDDAGVANEFSLESISTEARVGGVTNVLQRMWQVYFLDFLTTFDWVSDLVKSSSKRVGKYRDRIDVSRRKFNKKKPGLDQDKQKASYAQLHNYWVNEDGFIKDPFGQLKEEERVAKYVLFTYPENVAKEMKALGGVAKRAKFSDSEDYEKTVLKPLTGKRHPVELFDNKLLGGRPYMLNTGFSLSGKKVTEGSVLQRLAARRKVKVSKRLYGLSANSLVPRIIPDVEMTNREIEQLFDIGDDFLGMTEEYLRNTDRMKREIGVLKTALESLLDEAKKGGDKTTQSEVKQIGRYAKTLVDCYWAPSVKMSKRNIDIAKGIAYLANRLVAYSK